MGVVVQGGDGLSRAVCARKGCFVHNIILSDEVLCLEGVFYAQI